MTCIRTYLFKIVFGPTTPRLICLYLTEIKQQKTTKLTFKGKKLISKVIWNNKKFKSSLSPPGLVTGAILSLVGLLKNRSPTKPISFLPLGSYL